MIGEIGALGGSILPNVLAQSKQHTGKFGAGFIAYALFATMILIMLRVVARGWVKSWVGSGGRALVPSSAVVESTVESDDSLAIAS